MYLVVRRHEWRKMQGQDEHFWEWYGAGGCLLCLHRARSFQGAMGTGGQSLLNLGAWSRAAYK